MSLISRLVPSFIRKRYTMKFVVAFLAVVLVIGAIGGVSYAQVDQTVKEDKTNQLRSTAQLHAEIIGEWTRNMQVKTRMVSAAPVLQEANESQADGYIRGEARRLSLNVRAIHYVDLSNSSVIASTGSELAGRQFDEIDAPWASGGLNAQLQFGNSIWNSPSSYRSDTLGDEVIAFASPVVNDRDRAVVLVGTIERRVNALFQPLSNGTTRIVDSEGEPVLRAGKPVNVDEDTITNVSVSTVTGSETTVETRDGNLQAYAAVRSEGINWIAVSSVPTSTAYAVRSTVGTNVIAIVVSALLMLGGVGVVLGRHTASPLADLRDKSARMEEGDLSVDLSTGRIDEIGQLYDGFAEMRDSLRARIQEAQDARQDAEQAREQAERMTEHLEQKADDYSNVMAAVGDGDLTRRMDPDSRNEPMTDIAHQFNQMVDQVEATTARQKLFAEQVATTSQKVNASVNEVRDASRRVTESIQEISEGTENQDEALQSVLQEMENLSTSVEEIASLSNEVADLAERTAETGRTGREAAREAIQGMNSIEEESQSAVDQIRQLDREMDEIDELVEFVVSVANQTNRLALNANIEASRASSGEETEGFAAVANEIRELAADTKDATEDIRESVERVQAQADQTVDSVTTTGELIETNTASVRDAVDALDEIADYAEETNTGIQEITAATQQQAASTQQVVSMVDRATDISRTTATESQTVAAAAEQQTSAVDAVTKSADTLAEQANQLSESLDDFVTDVDPDMVFDHDTDTPAASAEDADPGVETDAPIWEDSPDGDDR